MSVLKPVILFIFILTVGFRIDADSISGADTVKQHLAKLREDPDNKEAIKAVAFHYLNVGNDDEAMKYGNRLLEIGKQQGDRNFCELYGLIVTASVDITPASYEKLQQALVIAEETDNDDALLSINNSLGIYHLFVNNDPYTSISYGYKALDYARKIGDKRRQAIILSNIAGDYLAREDTAGISLAREAHAISSEINEPVPLFYSKCVLLEFALLAGDADAAQRLILEAEKIHAYYDFPGDGILKLQRANLAALRGDIDSAYKYYAMAMENFGEVSVSLVTSTYLNYASFLRKQNYHKSAITILEYAIECAKENKSLIHTPALLKELSLCYKETDNLAKALEYGTLYQNCLDSTIVINREHALQETRVSHDIFSREQQIKEQQIEILASRNRLITLASILVIVVALLLLLWYFLRRQNRLYSAIVKQNSEYLSREKALLSSLEKIKTDAEKTTEIAPDDQHKIMSEERSNEIMMQLTSEMIEHKLFTDSNITVASLAAKLGTNRTYLSKAINDITGKTFTQLINEYRIKESIELISDMESNLPLKQIAADVGFNSISTFYTTFQSITGMTPARYRAKLKEIKA